VFYEFWSEKEKPAEDTRSRRHMAELYALYLKFHELETPKVCVLLRFMMVTGTNSAGPERIASCFKGIESKQRNRLLVPKLESLTHAKLNAQHHSKELDKKSGLKRFKRYHAEGVRSQN